MRQDNFEKTVVLIKPDGVSRALVGEVVKRFEDRGLQILGMKMMDLSEELVQEHYAHLADKPFFPGILAFMRRTPIVAMYLGGADAIETVRRMCGATKPVEAEMGTIRGDLAIGVPCNIVHASDSVETAAVEFKRFFNENEVFEYSRVIDGALYE